LLIADPRFLDAMKKKSEHPFLMSETVLLECDFKLLENYCLKQMFEN